MRQNSTWLVLAGVLPLVSLGCVQTPLHFGSTIPAPASIHIEKNQTTESQLVQRFGAPMSDTAGGGDLRVLTWTSSQITGFYNLGVTIPYYGYSGDEQSEQHVHETSVVAKIRNHVVIDYAIVDRTDGNNVKTIATNSPQ